jgi:hypothetical protein
VDKDIFVTVLRLNETITFLGVEPLDGTDGHSFSEMDGKLRRPCPNGGSSFTGTVCVPMFLRQGSLRSSADNA